MQFQVFYGDYNVLYGPNGVDLSAFKCTSSVINKPRERSFGSICKWLQRGFCVDPLTHVMTVQTHVAAVFVAISLFRQFCLLQVTWGRSTDSEPSCRGWAYSARPIPLTALVDRWRPETHTFHLPCGEMTPTLQDVAYLLGLPIVGEAVGPRVVAASWKDDMEACFALVDRVEEAGPINPHPRAAGPSKTWFL